MNRDVVRQWAVMLSVVATVVVNGLANALPLNGVTTGEISDGFDVLFVPAGYVFAIWSLIYLGLFAYGIYQALPAQKENPRLRAIGWPFVVGSIANMVWIFLWHYGYLALTVVAMLALLASLIVIYQRLGTGRTRVSRAETWLVRVPFSIYLGWITVATIANITNLLWASGWNGFGLSAEAWFVIMLGATVIIAGLMAYTRGDVAYLLVLVWALVGIAVKHAGLQPLVVASLIAAGLVGVAVIVAAVRSRRVMLPAGVG
jgi:benzodiazapine receptor